MDKKLPKDWQWVKLSEIGKIISGGTPSTSISEYWDGSINWIAPSDLTGYKNIRIKSGKKSITELGLKKSSARLMPKGSVLFSCRAPIGYTVIADEELCTNQGFKSIIPYDFVDSLYIYYFLKASKQDAEKVASGTTFKEISLKSFSELSFPLPPLETQQAIVSKIEELFSELDKGIEDLKTAQLQLKTYRQSVLKWAFEGKLTNENVKDGELPKGWEMLKIKDICEIKGGKNQSKVINQNGKYPIYGSSGIFGYADEYICDENTTIVGRKGNINSPLFVTTKFWNVDTAFGLCVNNKYDSKLLFYFCLGFNFKKLDKSTTIPSLAKSDILSIDIQVPPEKEQHLIVQEIESRLSVADKIEESITQSLQQAEALGQSILKKAFSGELV